MGDRTGIEWTDSTWNPVTGCTQVSSGCDNCYAMTLAHTRLTDLYLSRAPQKKANGNGADPFAVRLWPERLEQPLSWRNNRTVFVNSMSDMFHVDIPEDYIGKVFEVMLAADWHVYQILTKRPARAAKWVRRHIEMFPDGKLPSHIWIGTSVESQDVTYRIDHLRNVPAAVRFLSCEPLLGPLMLDLERIDWVIAGGESGIGFRPMDPQWVRSIRDQCFEAGVSFFFKQWGGRTPKAHGRELDGRSWDRMPMTRVA
ncbi:MAG: DUF5131 family protein [Gemmatimonadales bacterium]